MNISLLKNRAQPPGGWSYWCPVGEMDFPGGFAFDVQVSKIRQYRAANPNLHLPSDLGSVRNELLQFTFARLRKRLGAEEALKWFSVTDTDDAEIDELIKKKLPNLPSKPAGDMDARPAGGVVKTIRDLASGQRILRDWLGDGAVPVSPDKAQARADTCLACPLNQQGNWLQRLAGAVGGFIKEQVELKNEMSLRVNNEEHLFTCAACSCHLALKVWVPISTVILDTSEVQRNGLDKNCWIRNEGGL